MFVYIHKLWYNTALNAICAVAEDCQFKSLQWRQGYHPSNPVISLDSEDSQKVAFDYVL